MPLESRFLAVVCLLLSWLPVWSEPLKRQEVAKDAKWLIHLDWEQFRKTSVGRTLSGRIIGPQIERWERKWGATPRLALEGIQSLTTYGPNYRSDGENSSVLIVKASPKLRDELRKILLDQSKQGDTQEVPPVRRVKGGEDSFFAVMDDVYVSLESEGAVILGKSPLRIQLARHVLEGRSDSLADSDTFTDYPPIENAFVMLAVAEGFNLDAKMPPQARFLKMAEGCRVVLGEASRNVFLDLALRAKDPEVTTQIQQIVQGSLALLAFTQADNEDLMWVLNATQVARLGRFVTLNIKFPADKAVREIEKQSGWQEAVPEVGAQVKSD